MERAARMQRAARRMLPGACVGRGGRFPLRGVAAKNDGSMPPLYPHDPLNALHRTAWRWLDVAVAVGEVASEPWALALVALALYSWLEREVRGVVKSFLPLAAALAAAAALALLARAALAVPRPVDAGGEGLGGLLRHAFPTGHAAAVAVFATYSVLAYGRRAVAALALALVLALGRALAGPHWAAEVVAGGLAGAALGTAAYAVALRLVPGGHLARLRAARAVRSGAAVDA
jgi:membrane-associated phospholipid phosphatase